MEPLPLRDIHLPEPVGWWPPAMGWWLLLGGVLGLLALLIRRVRRQRRMTPVKLALTELKLLETMDVELGTDEKLRRLSILLRRVCLSAYPREEVAGLTGEDWLRWLDRPLPEPHFSQGPGRILLDGAYRPAPTVDLDELLALCRDWVKALAKREAGHR